MMIRTMNLPMEASMTRTIFLMTMFATPAFADSGEYGHMMGDGYGYGPV